MSKFGDLIKAVKEPTDEAESPAGDPKPIVEAPKPKPKPAARRKAKAAPKPEPLPTKERQPGRSRDPRYTKAMMYIPVELHEDVKRLLIGSGKNYSELCEELLQKWAERQK